MKMMIFNPWFAIILIQLFTIFPQLSYPSYLIQAGTPVLTQNFISPEDGCNWGGVAGQVFSLDGIPVEGRIIEINGQLEGKAIELSTTTGSSQQMGPGGYEFQLSDHPVTTQGALFLQIVDASGEPLSRRVYIETAGVCDHNLTIVNMREFDIIMEVYFPWISISQ
jgi:hypothetical protein